MKDLRIQAANLSETLRRITGVKDQIDATLLEGYQPGITIADLTTPENWHTAREGGLIAGAVCAGAAGNLSGATFRFTSGIGTGSRQMAVVKRMVLSSAVQQTVGFGVFPGLIPTPFAGNTSGSPFDTRDGFQWGNLIQVNFGNALAPGFVPVGVVNLGIGTTVVLDDVGVFLPGSSFGVLGGVIAAQVIVTLFIQIQELQNGEQ